MEPSTDFSKNLVFTEPYWKRPDSESQGDPEAKPIYESVGYALTQWEMMEEALADLYLMLVGASKTSDNPVRRAFGSIESNSGRRKAIDAAAEAYLGQFWNEKSIKSAFLILTNAIGIASKRRDDIAHGIAIGQILDNVRYGAFLFPPDYNTLRTNLYTDAASGDPLAHTMTKYRFTSAQIREMARKFKELESAVRHHTGLLMSGPETFVRAVTGRDIFGGKLFGR